MKRRQFLAALPLAGAGSCLATVIGFSLGGCVGEATSGVVEIKWDRDLCSRCKMVIGDRRFAAQTRDPSGKVWKFDDIGCAMFWLRQQGFDEQTPRAEFWVADYQTGTWLDARRAHYVSGKKSPMGYDLAALAEPQNGSASYADAKAGLLLRGK